jgi:hypothetical protein
MNAVKVFLSYASEDEPAAEKFYDQLHQDGLSPWMAKRDIHPGEDWERAIWRAVREAAFVLVCLSKSAEAKRGFLQKEIKQALEIWKEKLEDDIYLIPVKFEDCSVPRVLSGFHWVNLYEMAGYKKLLGSIAVGMDRRGSEFTRVLSTGPVAITSGRIEEREERRFDLSIEYPLLQPDSSSGVKTVNERLLSFAQEQAQKFRTEWVDKGYDPNDTSLWPSLEIRHSIGLFSESTLSIRFTILSFHPAAAHPNSNTRTFNFSFDPFVEYTFMELYRKDVDYLKVISEYCIRDIQRQRSIETGGESRSDTLDDWLATGAGPKHSNFQNLVLTAEGLDVIFDPYQVGSYAEGRREVRIPMTVLSAILKPDVLSALSQSG